MSTPLAAAERRSPARRAARGRPRSESARRKVLDAARTLFARGGYPAATIEAIAARSGVAKTTIYRWWANRAALLVDLLLESAATIAPPPVGRDPLRALRTEHQLVARAADALPGRLLQSLLGEAHRDAELRTALQRGLFQPRRTATADVVRRAQGQGQLRRGVAPLIAVDLLFGPLFYRRFVRQEPLTPGFLEQSFEAALGGLAAPPGRADRARRERGRPRPPAAPRREQAVRRRRSRRDRRAR